MLRPDCGVGVDQRMQITASDGEKLNIYEVQQCCMSEIDGDMVNSRDSPPEFTNWKHH
jgi:hypothetical protein